LLSVLTQMIGYFKASNTDANDTFGDSIVLSADGTTLAVSAPSEASAATGINGDQTNNSAFGAGAVYVFTRSGSSWSQQAYLKASNTEAGDVFGWSLALSADGNTLAVGADLEDSALIGVTAGSVNEGTALNGASQAGAVYVFTRSGASWTQHAYMKA